MRTYAGLRLFDPPLVHLADVPGRLAAAYGPRTALQAMRDGRLVKWTYRDLEAGANAFAARLAAAGVASGDRVLLLADNAPEWLIASFAIAGVGAVAVPLDPLLPDDDLTRLALHAEPTAAVVSERHVPLAGRAVGALPLFVLGAPADDAPAPPGRPAGRPGDAAAVLYTSGTNGDPKGVVLTHRNFLFDAERCLERLYTKPGDNYMALLPLHHAFSFTCTLIVLLSGIPVTFTPSLRPDALVATIRDTRVTIMPAVPLVLDHLARAIQAEVEAQPAARRLAVRALLWAAARGRDRFGAGWARALASPILRRLGGLRLVVSGGAPLAPASSRFFHDMGVAVLNGYGLTETAPVIALTPGPWHPGLGVGAPLRGVEVRIDAPDATGAGEVWVRGDNVMAGYYRDAAATEAALVDGWLKTGDVGTLDADGNLHLLGRTRSLIALPSGKKVYPEDLERHYGEAGAIAELCVVTGRDAAGGEFPFGVVVAAPGLDDPRAAVRTELIRLSAGLPEHRCLRRFELVEGPLPRTTTRKVKRHVVSAYFTFTAGEAVRVGRVPEAPAPAREAAP